MSLCVEVEYNERMDAHDKSYFLRTLHGYLNPENRWPDESLTEWFARTEQEWADYVNPKIHPKLRRG